MSATGGSVNRLDGLGSATDKTFLASVVCATVPTATWARALGMGVLHTTLNGQQRGSSALVVATRLHHPLQLHHRAEQGLSMGNTPLPVLVFSSWL